MISGKKYIAFDLGAESGRCTVGVYQDKKINLNEVHRFTTHNIQYSKGFHWDILGIYKELIEGLTKAVKLFGPDFEGIGVDTWGVDYVLIDSEGRILGYPYHYRDDRTDNIMEEAFNIVSKQDMYCNTGIQFAQINTVFQLLSESRREVNLLNSADKMLLIPDFLNFLLSGVKKSEYSIASTTGLVDPLKRNWSWQLIDSFKLPRRIFPEIVESGTLLGKILPAIAKLTGLNPNTRVYASACHDTASAVAAIPANGDHWAFLSSGTWSLIGVELKQPLCTNEAMKYNFTNEGGAEKSIRFLKNIIGLWPLQESRRYWQEKGKNYDYDLLMSLAKIYGLTGCWIDLNDNRFLKAGEMPNKIINYLDETKQPIKNDPGFITAVILESLAFCYRDTIKEIEEITGKKLETLYAVGGGIKNELLNQYTADATGKVVYTGPIEGTVIGNIGIQVIASGSVKNLEEWRKIVENSLIIKKFVPLGNEYFEKKEKEYKKLLKCNTALMQ